MYPTLLEMCGLLANPKNEGHSLVPLLNDPARAWSYPAIIGWKENCSAVQDERYRYIRYGDGSEELYDHERDLNEWTNLAGQAELAPVKRLLAEHLQKAGIDQP
jgi:hypothetical protein